MLRQAEKLSTPKNIRLLFWHKEPQSVRNCRISDHTGVQTLIPGLRLPFPAPFFIPVKVVYPHREPLALSRMASCLGLTWRVMEHRLYLETTAPLSS